jgi:hypothetical protein
MQKRIEGGKNMAGKISNFFRETQFVFSIILTIIGFIVLYIGIIPYLNEELSILPEEYSEWGFYLLVIGFIAFIAGVWYLYSFLKNKKFVLDELKTNKRSELLNRHAELKSTVRYLPSKYQKMLKDKEKELKIK